MAAIGPARESRVVPILVMAPPIAANAATPAFFKLTRDLWTRAKGAAVRFLA